METTADYSAFNSKEVPNAVESSKGFSLRLKNINVSDIKQYLYKTRYILGAVAALAFLFYWYELRPIQINNSCVAQAGANARTLLATKAAIATDPAQKASFQGMVDQNLYLRSDYESFYGKCLRSYGIF